MFFFIKETNTFGHICVWTILRLTYITLRHQHTTFEQPTACLPFFRVTSWSDTVWDVVTRWVKFRETICMSTNFNYLTTMLRSIFSQNVLFRVEKYIFTIFAYELFKVKMKNCKQYQKYQIFGSKYF